MRTFPDFAGMLRRESSPESRPDANRGVLQIRCPLVHMDPAPGFDTTCAHRLRDWLAKP